MVGNCYSCETKRGRYHYQVLASDLENHLCVMPQFASDNAEKKEKMLLFRAPCSAGRVTLVFNASYLSFPTVTLTW